LQEILPFERTCDVTSPIPDDVKFFFPFELGQQRSSVAIRSPVTVAMLSSGDPKFLIPAHVLSSVVGLLILRELKNRLYCRLAASVTSLQILSEWLVLDLCTLFDRTKRTNQISLSRRLQLALFSTVSAVGSNHVLVANSVCLFQLSKLLHIFVQRSVVRLTPKELLSRILILLGFAGFVIFDPDTNGFAALIAVVASLAGAYSRALILDLSKDFMLSEADIRLSFIPHHYSMAVIAATLLDNTGEHSFAYAGLTVGNVILIVITCACATVAALSAPIGLSLKVADLATACVMLTSGFVLYPSVWESSGQLRHAAIAVILAVAGFALNPVIEKKRDPGREL
jgi:hypothetical protein